MSISTYMFLKSRTMAETFACRYISDTSDVSYKMTRCWMIIASILVRPLDGAKYKSCRTRSEREFWGTLQAIYTQLPRSRNHWCLCASVWLVRIQSMLGGHCSSMQINPLLLKSPLFCSGVTAERRAAETPAVVREALEQQAPDRP